MSTVVSKGVDDVDDGRTLDVKVVLLSDGVVESVEVVVSGRTRDGGVCISRRVFPASDSRGRKDRWMMRVAPTKQGCSFSALQLKDNFPKHCSSHSLPNAGETRR